MQNPFQHSFGAPSERWVPQQAVPTSSRKHAPAGHQQQKRKWNGMALGGDSDFPHGQPGVRKGGRGATAPARKKKRFIWPDELHQEFVQAVFDLGLSSASPQLILETMMTAGNVGDDMGDNDSISANNVTAEQLATHLRKFRRHRRRRARERTEGGEMLAISQVHSAAAAAKVSASIDKTMMDVIVAHGEAAKEAEEGGDAKEIGEASKKAGATMNLLLDFHRQFTHLQTQLNEGLMELQERGDDNDDDFDEQGAGDGRTFSSAPASSSSSSSSSSNRHQQQYRHEPAAPQPHFDEQLQYEQLQYEQLQQRRQRQQYQQYRVTHHSHRHHQQYHEQYPPPPYSQPSGRGGSRHLPPRHLHHQQQQLPGHQGGDVDWTLSATLLSSGLGASEDWLGNTDAV